MKQFYLIKLCLLLFLLSSFTYSEKIKNNPPNENNKIRITKKRINIEIDASDKIGSFNEKVTYNLDFSDNDLKSVSLEKRLPQIDTKFFDVMVTSNDVKILKFEVKEDKNNFNKNNKILEVEFEPINKMNFNIENNFNQATFDIQYSYKIKDKNLKETTSEVKNTYYLKDANLYEDASNFSYPAKFTVLIKNLPELHMDLKNNNLRKTDSPDKDLSFSFEQRLGGMNKSDSNSNDTRPVSNSNNSNVSRPQNDNYNTNNNGNSKQVTYTYYKKTSNHKQEPNIWESIIAILMVICLCYLCCHCCMQSNVDSSNTKQDHNDQAGNNLHNNENVAPDGYTYYCN